MAINREGLVSICVRFDPKGLGVLGSCNKQTLEEIWNGELRLKWLELHKKARKRVIFRYVLFVNFGACRPGVILMAINYTFVLYEREFKKKGKYYL